MIIIHVEDDPVSQTALADILRTRQLDAVVFAKALDALHYITTVEPDVMFIDYWLSNGPDGLKLAGKVRQQYPTCVIIIISQFATYEYTRKALQLGLDDYIKKPITSTILDDMDEALLKRRSWFPRVSSPEPVPNLHLDKSRNSVRWYDREVGLTGAELEILAMLTSKPEQVFEFSDLYAAARNSRVSSEEARNLLKPHIRNLRHKLNLGDVYPDHIVNVRGKGYKWDNNPKKREN